MAGESFEYRGPAAGGARFRVLVVVGAAGVLAATVAPSLVSAYIVAPGETLSDIAARNGLSVDELVRANGIENPDLIFAGEVLNLGHGASAQGSPGAGSSSAYATHVVLEGDTLSGLADHYGVTMDAIAAANGVSDADQIFIGQVLTIPGAAPVAHVSHVEAEAILRSAEAEFGLPHGLLLALAWQESGWQQGIVSEAGAVGITQLLPDTADWAIEQFVPDAHNWQGSARDNARMGAAVLAYYLHRSDGDVRLSLAAYYQGWRSVHERGLFDDTVEYVDNVIALASQFN